MYRNSGILFPFSNMSEKKKNELIEAIASAEKYSVDPAFGLNDEQIAKRNKDGLDNKSPKKVTKTYWKIFKDNVLTFFNIVLFLIAGLMFSAKLPISNYLFLFILLANIMIGVFTDIRARHLLEKLKVITDPKIIVIRNGIQQEIPAEKAVLSDIMILKAGEQICADAEIIEGEVFCDESLLTGENDPVEKKSGDEVLSGSFIKSGTCKARIIRVGIASFAEGLQDSAKQFKRPKSEIKRSCLAIFWATGIIALVIGTMYLLTWLLGEAFAHDGFSYERYVTDFVAPAGSAMVATIPTGLSLLLSVSLTTGVIRLAGKHMNVQELYCIEMLARVDTICFDKTGTLTNGNLTVIGVRNYSDFTDEELRDVIGNIVYGTGDENPTALALKTYSKEATEKPIATLPFSSDIKCSAVQLESGTYILGAPEFIDAEIKEDAKKQIEEYAKKGYRVLGVFHNKKPLNDNKIPGKSTLICLIYLMDQLKEDAKRNIEWFVNNDVAVKVISGDNAMTVAEIARQAGVPNADKYISMEGVNDEDIPFIANEYVVFGRAKPEQKALLLKAMQEKGHKVAMTGDGVNDIVALKTADCSIAMASGSSAARSVAHIVSVDNDFSKLPDVVSEGRRVINNLQRTSSLFLAKTTFAIAISIIFLIVSWSGGPGYPFKPQHLIIWEIFGIGMAGFVLALQPSKERLKGKFLSNVNGKAFPAGFIQILSVLLVFTVARFSNLFDPDATVSICVLIMSFLSIVILSRICWPFDLYRGAVVGGMGLVSVTLFVIDCFALPATTNKATGETTSVLFGMKYDAISNSSLWMIIAIAAICVAMYFVVDFIVTKLLYRKRREK